MNEKKDWRYYCIPCHVWIGEDPLVFIPPLKPNQKTLEKYLEERWNGK
jgi:nitrate reductase cytochrome c-type subunit